MIDLKLMRQFVAVAEALNFRKAAQRLNMSQPPLSVAIHRLEQCLGVQLLLRNTRGAQLTPAGAVFLAEARNTLLQAERACEMARRSAAGVVGTVRLGFIDSIVDRLLPTLLKRYHTAYPDVDIQLLEATPPEQIERLRDDRLDMGILVLPVINLGDINIEPLFEDRMVAVLPRDHSLAHGGCITLADLEDQPWILFAPHHGPGMHSRILMACASAGFTPHVVQKPRQMQTTAALVAAGLGVALMPERYARLRSGLLACVELTGPGTPVAYAVGLSYRKLSPCTQLLRSDLLEISERFAEKTCTNSEQMGSD